MHLCYLEGLTVDGSNLALCTIAVVDVAEEAYSYVYVRADIARIILRRLYATASMGMHL